MKLIKAFKGFILIKVEEGGMKYRVSDSFSMSRVEETQIRPPR